MFFLSNSKQIDLVNVIFISAFSFFINFYYSNLGSFPIDTFLHYDTGYRILKNEFPIRDYWIVSGAVVDFIQSFFFNIFGVKWNALVYHSSVFNLIISIFTYNFFLKLKIKKLFALIFTISFSILAYTVSGTPFVDHHAIFFALLGTYLLIMYFDDTSKNYYWFPIVLLFFLSFFSKQVPAAYLIILYSIIIFFYVIIKKRYDILLATLTSFFVVSAIFTLILFILRIDLDSLILQFIDYPRSIGLNRLDILDVYTKSFVSQFKFILLPIIIYSILIIKKNSLQKIEFNNEIVKFLFLFSFGACCILNQLLTKNQIFIYFLIPIFFGLVLSELNLKNKINKYFSYIIILLVIFLSIKYHFRFNENRKFHELNKDMINNAIDAENIHSSLKGLKWINPSFSKDPEKEIEILKKGKKIIDEENSEVMLITHYLFFDTLTSKNLNSPSRTFTIDGASFPTKNNRYYDRFNNLVKNKIIKNKIEKILFFKHEKIPQDIIKNIFDEKCLRLEQNEIFFIFKINCIT